MLSSTPARIVRLIFSLAVAAVAVVIVAIGSLVQLGVYTPNKTLAVALIIAVAVATFYESSRSAYRAYTEPKRQLAMTDVATTVMGTVNAIASDLDLQNGVVGGSVFVAKKRFIFRRSWLFLKFTTVLIRPPYWRIRYADGPQASMVRWTTNKGAVGQAYQTGKPAYKHWAPVAKNHGRSSRMTKEEFASLSDDVKSGFTYKEFTRIAAKYTEVLAAPIVSAAGDKLVGVISIDRPYREAEEPKELFDTQSVEEAVIAAAISISESL